MSVITLNQVSADGTLIRTLARGAGRQDVAGAVPEGARLTVELPDGWIESQPLCVFDVTLGAE